MIFDAQADHELAPSAIVLSGLGLASLTETGLIEKLPKGALVFLVSIMFGAILFFVKRDYSRITETLEKHGAALRELRAIVELNQRDMLIQLSDCVKVHDFSQSADRIYAKLNKIDNRTVILETKAGMHNEGHFDNEGSGND